MPIKRLLIAGVIALAGAGPLLAEEFRPIFNPPAARLDQALGNDGDRFSILIGLLQKADLPELKSGKPFTLLAAPDQAFAAMPKATVAKLSSDKGAAQAFVRRHLLPGLVKFAGRPSEGPPESLTTAAGTTVTVACEPHPGGANTGCEVSLDKQAHILAQDIMGAHAAIQVIDRPLDNGGKT